MITIMPQCMDCKHLTRGGSLTCAAYPEGIPRTILLNEWDHRKPQPGDHDIQFAAMPGRRHYLDDYEESVRGGSGPLKR